jgi:DNA-binding response OmpR family regulator
MAVDIAYDGHEADAKVNLHPYDVVVLDRDLPGIHGDELCRIITGAQDPAMILMLTAAGTPEDRVTGLALGADAQRRTLQAVGIELDPLIGTVTRNGANIELTAKERAVLEALLTATPARLSAEQLLEQGWDENVDPFTNTVRVTIARLRRKLGPPNIIHNTPGIGYGITEAP